MKQLLWAVAKRLATDPAARAGAARLYADLRPRLEQAGRTVAEIARETDPRTQPAEFGRRLGRAFRKRDGAGRP